jgi:glutamate-1-semialdehyde 2,1-aminomutase
VVGNAGCIPPNPGYLEALRAITARDGTVLIFDEVMTGFRLALGGAQERYSICPDMTCLGKILGGGLPCGAFGGREEIMRLLAPLGPVYQAGTLSGNPVAVAAGIATLRLADADIYARLDAAADSISTAVSAALAAEGVEHVVQRAGNLFSFAFTAEPPRTYDQVKAQQAFRYAPFFHAMLDAGVSLPPSVFEAWFVTAAHDDAAIDRILDALPAAAKAAAAAKS